MAIQNFQKPICHTKKRPVSSVQGAIQNTRHKNGYGMHFTQNNHKRCFASSKPIWKSEEKCRRMNWPTSYQKCVWRHGVLTSSKAKEIIIICNSHSTFATVYLLGVILVNMTFLKIKKKIPVTQAQFQQKNLHQTNQLLLQLKIQFV